MLPGAERDYGFQQTLRSRSKRSGIHRQKGQRYIRYPRNLGGGIKTGGGKFFSLDHAEKAHSGYLSDPGSAWKDDVLIATMLEHGDIIVNPIYYWTDDEVWQYIREQKMKVNPLYYDPYCYERVGCVLCPMSGYREKKRQEQDFPGYKRLYIHAFDRMLQARKDGGLENRSGWETGEDVYRWWIEEYKHSVKGQISIDDWLKSLGGDDGNS